MYFFTTIAMWLLVLVKFKCQMNRNLILSQGELTHFTAYIIQNLHIHLRDTRFYIINILSFEVQRGCSCVNLLYHLRERIKTIFLHQMLLEFHLSRNKIPLPPHLSHITFHYFIMLLFYLKIFFRIVDFI